MAAGANSSLVLITENQLDIRHCCSILCIKLKFVKVLKTLHKLEVRMIVNMK